MTDSTFVRCSRCKALSARAAWTACGGCLSCGNQAFSDYIAPQRTTSSNDDASAATEANVNHHQPGNHPSHANHF